MSRNNNVVEIKLDRQERRRLIRALRTQMHREKEGNDEAEARAMAELWDKVAEA